MVVRRAAAGTKPDAAVVERTVTTDTTWTDPREQLEAVVMMANGRLAPRSFADRAAAEAWAKPELGDQVLERNLVCSCDS
ncbi:hypothetical protein CXY01_40010 [Cellulomonas xylanilytica]|uniref:Uncharacterized protein n=1 Tax=Cellulomonas xylanilytica TaxID=233583 RepID=A0A510VBU5_9CELL|nr:hypothetical protein CXY01_40010 [Cellulomonas xylanilytica]